MVQWECELGDIWLKSVVWVRWNQRKFPRKRCFSWDLKPCYAKCGPWMICLSITWELFRNADSQIPPQTHSIRLCILIRFPRRFIVHESLGSADLRFQWEWRRALGVLECCSQRDLHMQRLWLTGEVCVLQGLRRGLEVGGAGGDVVPWQPREECFKRMGVINTAERQEKGWKLFDAFSRDFWLPFEMLFWWSNTGASQYEVGWTVNGGRGGSKRDN